MECSGSVGSGTFQSLSGNGQAVVTCGPYQSWYLVSFLDHHMEGVSCLSDVFWVKNVMLQSSSKLGLTKLSDISVYIKGCLSQSTKAWDNRKQVQLKFVSKHACQCEWCERACDKTYNACCSEHHFGFTHAETRLVRVCQGHCYRTQPTIRLYT